MVSTRIIAPRPYSSGLCRGSTGNEANRCSSGRERMIEGVHTCGEPRNTQLLPKAPLCRGTHSHQCVSPSSHSIPDETNHEGDLLSISVQPSFVVNLRNRSVGAHQVRAAFFEHAQKGSARLAPVDSISSCHKCPVTLGDCIFSMNDILPTKILLCAGLPIGSLSPSLFRALLCNPVYLRMSSDAESLCPL